MIEGEMSGMPVTSILKVVGKLSLMAIVASAMLAGAPARAEDKTVPASRAEVALSFAPVARAASARALPTVSVLRSVRM